MEKPAAYTASILVLLLVLMETSTKVTNGAVVGDGGDQQHAKVCLDPGPNGSYNVACSLIVGRHHSAERLKQLLSTIGSEYFNVPRLSSCMNPIRRDDGHAFMAYGFAFCSERTTYYNCYQCLQSAIQVILNKCDNRVAGAQASSERCCIRYESKPFCTP
ncbi:hypothetical protein LINGRAHAP2_LOCUS12156 [Linum grandiflorum]